MEIWKPIPGWEGLYEVSDHGNVRSLDRVVRSSRNAERVVQRQGQVLRPDITRHGYELITLQQNGRRCRKQVHQFVMLAFVGPPPQGMEVCHNDGDRTNNCLSNLRYGTRKDNAQDRVKHLSQSGENNGKAKLNNMQVRLLRKAKRGTVGLLCKEFGICPSMASYIRARKNWSHIA